MCYRNGGVAEGAAESVCVCERERERERKCVCYRKRGGCRVQALRRVRFEQVR